MRKENAQLKTDKAAVVNTLQQMMSQEQFKSLRKEAEESEDVKRKVLKEYMAKKQALRKEEEMMNKTLKDKDEDISILKQKGQELELEHDSLQSSKTQLTSERDALNTDKQHLLQTVQALMRENSNFKDQLRRCPANQVSPVQPARKPITSRPLVQQDPTAVMGATSLIDGYLA